MRSLEEKYYHYIRECMVVGQGNTVQISKNFFFEVADLLNLLYVNYPELLLGFEEVWFNDAQASQTLDDIQKLLAVTAAVLEEMGKSQAKLVECTVVNV
jgi:hypothetical protein